MARSKRFGGSSGCDTLHGVRIGLTSHDKASLPPACIATSPTHAHVRDIGGVGFWFSVAHVNPSRVDFFLLAMREPLPCADVQSVVPRMRSAAAFAQEACLQEAREIHTTPTWSPEYAALLMTAANQGSAGSTR